MTRTEFLDRIVEIAPDALSKTITVGNAPVTYIFAPELRVRFKEARTHEARARLSSFVLVGESVAKDLSGLFLSAWDGNKREMKDFNYRGN